MYRQQLCNRNHFLSRNVEMNNKGILFIIIIITIIWRAER